VAPSLAVTPATGSGAVPAHALDPPPSRSRASPDDPVVLNSATEGDLRRLPGIGAKRAEAILALRARLGRFRAVEDLLKVKGVGRATLKRLRPLLRLDAGR
jgi:competence protein ComEA